ncbi:hypothetical protein COCOBI_02-0680 [Coccomyxa sp. Obi]|nr:hypothetical protein COCOBI_02-0680 [Coccomyxa sp. Obi]
MDASLSAFHWLPCSRPPMRRREGIARATASPASPASAADDSEGVAHVGPFLLTRQDCIRYILPAAALRILTSCLDGKGMLLLAQGTVIVMAAAAVAAAYMTTSTTAAKRMVENEYNGFFVALVGVFSAWAYAQLLIGLWERFIVPITVSYPFYAGTLPVLAPAALFIKQHPAVAAGCYSAAKAIPYALCIAAAVAIVRRAAARMLAASADPSKAAGPAAGTGGPVVASDASMPEHVMDAFIALQAENSRLRTRLDDIAKRLGAVEDYSGDDEAQNMPLRRVGEVEDKLAQVARLLASEIQELKEALATQKADEDAGDVSPSDLEEWNVKLDAAARQMQQFQEDLQAVNAKHAQLLQEVAGKADAAAASELEARITESLQQVSALRQQLLEHCRVHSAAAQAQEADSDRSRLDAAESALEDLKEQLQINSYAGRRQDELTESRLDEAEEQIAALQRASEEAAAAGGSSLQTRLSHAEDRIKGLACLVEKGLLESETDIAKLKRRLGCCAEGEEATSRGSVEQRLHKSEEEITALKELAGKNVDMKDYLEVKTRLWKAEGDLEYLCDTVNGDADIDDDGPSLQDRMKDAEGKIAALQETADEAGLKEMQLRVLEASLAQSAAEERFDSRLTSAEKEIEQLKLDDDPISRVVTKARLDHTDSRIKQLEEKHAEVLDTLEDGPDTLAPRLAAAELIISEQLGFTGSEELQGETVLARLEGAERTIARLQEEMTCKHSEAEECAEEEEDDDEDMSEEDEEEAENDSAMLRMELFGDDGDDDDEGVIDHILSRLLAAEREVTRLQELTCKQEAAQQGAEQLAEQLKDAQDRIQRVWDEVAGTQSAMARLDDAEAEMEALKERLWVVDEEGVDAVSVVARLEETERLVTDLQEIVTEDSEAAQDTAQVLSRLEEAEDKIAALKQQPSGTALDAMEVMARLQLAEGRISELTRVVNDLADAAEPRPEKTEVEITSEMEWIPEEKRREWLQRGVPKSEWYMSWVKDCKERSEADDDNTLEQKLRGIQSSLHSELRGDYWGLDIKGFQGRDAAVGSKATQQVKASAENVSEGYELQLVKPRPAPEPEMAKEEEASTAWDREGVTSEKIQALKRTLDTRTPTEAQPATSKTVAITWEEEEAPANPTSGPSKDTTAPQAAGNATAQDESSAAAAKDARVAAKIAADGDAADGDLAAVMADAIAAVDADVSDARMAAELAAADAATAAAAAAARAGAVAAAAVTNTELATDKAAAGATAAAAASMAAAAAIDADVAVTAADDDVGKARLAAELAAADSAGAAAAAAATAAAAAAADVAAAAADVSGVRSAAEQAAAFSKELAVQWVPYEAAIEREVAAAREDRPLRPSKQAGTLGEREVPIQMVDDIPDQPTSEERATTGAGNGVFGDSVTPGKLPEAAKAQEDPSSVSAESNEKPHPEAAATVDHSGDVRDEDSFDLDVETDELWNLMVDAIESSEKPQRKAAATADGSGDVSDEDSFDLDVELWNPVVASTEESDEKAQRKAGAAADGSDDDSDDGSDEDSDEDSFDLDIQTE